MTSTTPPARAPQPATPPAIGPGKPAQPHQTRQGGGLQGPSRDMAPPSYFWQVPSGAAARASCSRSGSLLTGCGCPRDPARFFTPLFPRLLAIHTADDVMHTTSSESWPSPSPRSCCSLFTTDNQPTAPPLLNLALPGNVTYTQVWLLLRFARPYFLFSCRSCFFLGSRSSRASPMGRGTTRVCLFGLFWRQSKKKGRANLSRGVHPDGVSFYRVSFFLRIFIYDESGSWVFLR